MKFASRKQVALFEAIERSGRLVFACGPRGISTNLVGEFSVRKNHRGEDQLDVGDGTNHVHIDWSIVRRFEVGESDGEGTLTFFDGEKTLFKFYRIEGPFSNAISNLSGKLLD